MDTVTLEIADGELFTLLGPSGCGKTTLLRLIAGFHRPDAGRIRFGERDVTDLPPYARNIGMVFQNYALWPHMTVFQNIAYGLRLRRLRGPALAARVEEGLRTVNLSGLGARYPGQLSGGQQQRVALARALVLSPDILLLDEPLSNLDAKIRVQVRAEIRTLQQELGITTVYVTHDQEEALSSPTAWRSCGTAASLQLGPPRGLYERPRTRFVADFVGTNNLVAGRVVEADGDGHRGDRTSGASGPGRRAGEASSGWASPACSRSGPENVAIGVAGAVPTAGDGNRCSRADRPRLLPRQHPAVRRGDRQRAHAEGGHPGCVAPRPARAGATRDARLSRVGHPRPSPDDDPPRPAARGRTSGGLGPRGLSGRALALPRAVAGPGGAWPRPSASP